MAAKSVSRIDALTDRQLAQLDKIRDEWIAIGLSCEPVDLPRAKKAVAMAYRAAGLAPPKQFIVLDSPMSAAIGAAMIFSQVESQVESQVGLQVGSQVWSQVWSQVVSQVRSQVRSQVWSQVGSQVWSQVESQVESQVRSQVESQVESQVLAMCYGAHSAGCLSFYDALRRFGLMESTSPLLGMTLLAKTCGWWTPYRDIAIFQHRHAELHRNVLGQLHRDGGMAVCYRDGWGLWALNGVRVPQWLAETPAESINAELLLAEDNAEIRREIVRKVGAERIAYKLGAKSLDKSGDYELLNMPIGNSRHARALKMLNPSVPECWHIEFVAKECQTVQEALNFRNGLTPEMIDDVNGADWMQQGDVILRPKGATKFKSRPIILT